MNEFPLHVAAPGGLALRHIGVEDVPTLHQLVELNREGLLAALDWPRFVRTQADTHAFCAASEVARQDRKSATYGVWRGEALQGVVSFNVVHHASQSGDIGYWLGSAARGKGVASTAVAAMIRAFSDADLVHHCIIKCATGNERSKKLAERLGFVREGVLSKAEKIGDVVHDQYVYSLDARRAPVLPASVQLQ